jgi:hypothetical protein
MVVQEINEERGHHPSVRTPFTHRRVGGLGRYQVFYLADGWLPARFLLKFVVEIMGVGTNHITDTAPEALILIGEPRHSVLANLEGTQVVSGTEGKTSAAPSTETCSLDLGY